MRNGRAISFPPPEDDDFEDVYWALTAATTLWERGDDVEALKWLRRAAGAAADRDADVRAVELFKAAADVASEIESADLAKAKKRAPGAGPPTSNKGAPPRPDPSGSATSDAEQDGDRRTPPPLPPRPERRGVPPAPARLEARSNIVPPSPPEPRVSSKPTVGRSYDESEQDTFVLPETALRRALTDIDPGYPERIDYGSTAGDDGAGDDEDDEEDQDTQVETQRRAKPSTSRPRRRTLVPVGVLPALRVAVLHIPEDGDVRLLFLSPGATPPPGVATALLVPPTQRDAELLTEVYAKCDAKL